MTVSRLRVVKSETRDLAERDRASVRRLLGEPTDWQLGNRSFFTGFVLILGVLAMLALVLR